MITTKQRKAIAALLTAPDYKTAAEMTGCSYRTLTRWLTDREFLAELHQVEGEIVGAAVRGLIGDLDKNLRTMREIRDDERTPKNLKLRATQVIDQAFYKWREALDIEQRLSALETKVFKNER